jgi:hypothetical protein
MDAESLMGANYVSGVQNIAQMVGKQRRYIRMLGQCGSVTNTRNKDK